MSSWKLLFRYRSKFCMMQTRFHSVGQIEPSCIHPGLTPKWIKSAREGFENLSDGANIFVHGGAVTPTMLLESLYTHVMERNLKDINLYHLATLGEYPFTTSEAMKHFRTHNLQLGDDLTISVDNGDADFYPVFISEVPALFRRRVIPLDMALISVSPPAFHGYCSLSASVDVTRAAIRCATEIIAQVNPNLPVTMGDAEVHISHIDYMIEQPAQMHIFRQPSTSIDDIRIAKFIAEELVEDGACIHAGLGVIPQAAMEQLVNHKDLGIHTEALTDAIVDLVSLGAITNRNKYNRPGKILATYAVGRQKVYDFIHKNPAVDLCAIDYVAAPRRFESNPNATSINSCLAMDLSGQMASDSIGSKFNRDDQAHFCSGVGALIDFLRQASLCTEGQGRPIIGLRSRNEYGEPAIVPVLTPGSGVVVTRAHVHYVVTEYGIANLFGKSLRQRAHELIRLAHPDDRENLERAAFRQMKKMPTKDP